MSFFGNAQHFFKNLFNQAPSWSQTASTTLKLIAPLTGTIVELTAGDAGAAQATRVISEVQSDLAVASSLLAQSHGNPTAPDGLVNSLNAAKANLQGLLTAGHIKDPATVKKVEAAVNTISGEVDAIRSIIPAVARPAAAASVGN
jgi:hypothetical protein